MAPPDGAAPAGTAPLHNMPTTLGREQLEEVSVEDQDDHRLRVAGAASPVAVAPEEQRQGQGVASAAGAAASGAGAGQPSARAQSAADAGAQPAVLRRPVADARSSTLAGRCRRALAGCGPRGGQLCYPRRFKALLAVVVGASVTWVCYFAYVVLPAVHANRDEMCAGDTHPRGLPMHNTRTLLAHFAVLVFVRALLFVPSVASGLFAMTPREACFIRVVCDGPAYNFLVGSWVFCLHIMTYLSFCEFRTPRLYQTLRTYAFFNCFLSALWLLFVCWHNSLLGDVARTFETREIWPELSEVTPDAMAQLETRSYEDSLAWLEEEDGRPFPPACPICLATWEPADVIKVTRCQHAFHEECISKWLRRSLTCAVCRQAVAEASPPSSAEGAPHP